MREERKRRLALFALVLLTALPLVIPGIGGWRWRIWWTPPGAVTPWPLPIPVILPESAA